MHLEILYQDQHIVAINKPHNLLVHRSRISAQDTIFVLQLLRDQIGHYLYPIHRLDRKTSGVLLFGLSKDVASHIHGQINSNQLKKSYIAIIRGYLPSKELKVDYQLTNDSGKVQQAVTSFSSLKESELLIPHGKYATSRYSLIEARPLTGRFHQIRKHLKHIYHPIIADRPHGCNKQNKLFKEKWQMTTMLLHAKRIEFVHPINQDIIQFDASPFPEFIRMIKTLQLD